MASSVPKEIETHKMFGGYNRRYRHDSGVLGCSMTFYVFFPPAAAFKQVPVLYWLSGLTCTDENFIFKSGVQSVAAAENVAVVCPDTSPRGLKVEGASDSWDFGEGAGWYLNATQDKWHNWRMYDYVCEELPQLLKTHFSAQLDTSKASIFGHSMGGHGALVIFFKNPGMYKSVSAFAPICNPVETDWGRKAFLGYLGNVKELWKEYDATHLAYRFEGQISEDTPILIDQGDLDKFYRENQLLPEHFYEACSRKGIPLKFRLQEGYDHSYFFIATYVDEHIKLHAKALHG